MQSMTTTSTLCQLYKNFNQKKKKLYKNKNKNYVPIKS